MSGRFVRVSEPNVDPLPHGIAPGMDGASITERRKRDLARQNKAEEEQARKDRLVMLAAWRRKYAALDNPEDGYGPYVKEPFEEPTRYAQRDTHGRIMPQGIAMK